MLIAIIYSLALTSCSNAIKVELPRFQHNTEKRVIRRLAVLYSPDDISASTTLSELGYPNRFLFLLHQEHPQLKITMQTVPANRYIAEPFRDVNTIMEQSFQGICCRTLWRMIMDDPLLNTWMELGNHGYSHSPPNDSNLDHHEFSATQNGCNFNHNQANDLNYCKERFRLARAAYQQIGLDNNKIIVMRFPGFATTDAGLRALLDNGFIAFFGNGGCGQEKWIPLSDGREILNIPSTSLSAFYNGQVDNAYLDDCVRQGGLINFFDHWWDLFKTDENGTNHNYQIVSANLRYLEQTYSDQVWWPFGSELALWLQFKRNAIINWETTDDHLKISAVASSWNPDWREINISYSITLLPQVRVRKIEYSSGITWHELNPSMYWQEGSNVYLNVPFTGNVTVDLSLSKPTIFADFP